MLPSPTAEPAAAAIKPSLDVNLGWTLGVFIIMGGLFFYASGEACLVSMVAVAAALCTALVDLTMVW